MSSRTLFLAWQNPETRGWHTFARLQKFKNDYELMFTRGADHIKAIPLDMLGLNAKKRYLSSDLLPIFRNRLPSRRRSDFEKMSNWLALTGEESEIDLLARFGLIAGVDGVLIYPAPDLIDGLYSLKFFVHGIRHMHPAATVVCRDIKAGDQVLPMLDVQNPVDPDAVALRCGDPAMMVGYVPSFYAGDIRKLLLDDGVRQNAKIRVVRNNFDAPVQIRLLCQFESPVFERFRPLDTESHQPLLAEVAA
jgi:hypothetical protein